MIAIITIAVLAGLCVAIVIASKRKEVKSKGEGGHIPYPDNNEGDVTQ